MKGAVAYILSKVYTDNSLKGISGTLAGKNCTISKTEEVEGGTNVTFTWTADDGTKKNTTIFVKDGGTRRVRLTSDGDDIKLDGVTQTFEQIRDLIMDEQLLVTLNLQDNMAFLPSSYDGNAIWFDSGFIMENIPTQMRVIINDQNQVKVDQIDLATKESVQNKVLKLNTALSEADLLNLLATTHANFKCSGFFYNTDINDYCEFEGLYVPYKIGSETVHFGYCHMKGLHGAEHYVDYYIDDEDGGTWHKKTVNDYLAISTEQGNKLVEKEDGLYVSGGGEGGTSDYADLENKPKINGVELSGNKTSNDLNLVEKEDGKGLISTTDVAQIAINKQNIETLNGNESVDGSVDKKIATAISTLNKLGKEVVTVLPSVETAKDNTLYLLKIEGSNNYMQYLKINSELVALGTTEVNLDNYVQKEEGKALSDNNYTDEDKLKVTSIPSDIASTVESLSTEVESLNGDVADVQSDVGAVGEKIGDLSTLKTTEKSNLVGAINEINDSLVDNIGDLSELKTTDKSNVVNAINEVAESGGGGGISNNFGTPIDIAVNTEYTCPSNGMVMVGGYGAGKFVNITVNGLMVLQQSTIDGNATYRYTWRMNKGDKVILGGNATIHQFYPNA